MFLNAIKMEYMDLSYNFTTYDSHFYNMYLIVLMYNNVNYKVKLTIPSGKLVDPRQ